MTPTLVCAQTELIDSLFRNVQAANSDEERLAAWLSWAEEHASIHRDTLDKYMPDVKVLADKLGSPVQRMDAALAYANWYYRWGLSDSSIYFVEKLLPDRFPNLPGDRDVYFRVIRALALYHGSKSRYQQSLDLLYEMQKLAAVAKDTTHLVLCLNSLGSVYINLGHPEKALDFILRAERHAKTGRLKAGIMAPVYINAATAYAMMHKFDSAGYYIRYGIKLSRSIQHLHYLATAIRIQAKILVDQQRYREAEPLMLEMFELRRKMGPVSTISDDYLQLASFYEQSNQLDKAIEVCKRQLFRSAQDSVLNKTESVVTDPKIRLLFYEALARYLKGAKRVEEYTEILEKIISAKDSFYVFNSARAIAEMEAKYSLQIKEGTILLQQYELQRKNFLFYGLLFFLVFLTGVGLYLFKHYRAVQQAKLAQILAEEKQVSEAAVKLAQEDERRRIAADLHDHLGVQVNAILHNTGKLMHGAVYKQELAEDLHETAREMLLHLRETLWAMKSPDISTDELWMRIITFSKQMGRHYGGIQFRTEGTMPGPVKIASARALHLVMIVQEAVNNAVKHAQADLVTIRSERGHSVWRIVIVDSGIGFNPALINNPEDGHGLRHLQERAKSADFLLSIHTRSGNGTSIVVEVDVEQA
ncbi:MAG TPA: ATP-binding protein [Lacibacter sp.]|nr:ATP-binding protein [Lacibacter sp.]